MPHQHQTTSIPLGGCLNLLALVCFIAACLAAMGWFLGWWS